MNIIIITWSYWPNKDGVQMVTQYQAEELVKLGHNVTVLTRKTDENSLGKEINNGVNIYRFLYKSKMKHEYGEKKELQEKVLELSQSSDVIMTVCVQCFAFTWISPILEQIKCRKVLMMHGMREEHLNWKKIHDKNHLIKELILTFYWKIFFKFQWNKIMKFDACCHLFKNDISYNYFCGHGFKNNYVLQNCCEEEFYMECEEENINKIRKKYDIREPFFILVANYGENKNQIEAIREFYKIKDKKFMLVCIGTKKNQYYEEVCKVNEKLSAEYHDRIKVKILEGISREDTRLLIRASYSSLLVSKNEYFPITIVESMAAGKPFISSEVGVVPMLPGGNIYHNTKELNYWLNYYIENPEYVKEMGMIAQKYAEKNLRILDKVRELEYILKGEV